MSEFRGKTALVTGGTSGIGRATALELARRGAAAVLFLFSPGASFITGHDLRVDGGFTVP